MTNFLLNSAICLAAFYGFYHCLLRRETFFNLNRFFLLATAGFALLIPALKIEIFKNEPPQLPTQVIDYQQLPTLVEDFQIAPKAMQSGISKNLSPEISVSIGEVFGWVYLSVAAVFALFFMLKMTKLLGLLRRCRKEKSAGCTLAELPGENLPAASFFGFVFWKKGSEANPLIFQHELAHVRGWHSVDVVLAEMLVIFQWFNPMAWSFRRSLRALHEYIADDWVVRNTQRRFDYALVLAKTAGFQPEKPRQTSIPQFFNSSVPQLKNRLVMLSKSPSRKISLGKYLLALPLAAALMLLFSFRLVEKIELPAPLENALSTANSFVEKISQTPVYQQVAFSENENSLPGDQPIFAAENTPYIFYWGQFQAKIQQLEGTEHFFAEVNLAALDFQQAIDREPRLWNGKSLESLVSFNLTDANGQTTAIRSNYQNAETYFQCRKTLNERYPKIEGGGHFVISDLALPNGKLARIDLFFAESEDETPKIIRRESNYQDMTAEQRKTFFADKADYVWGKHIDSRSFKRRFFSAAEFRESVAEMPKYIENGVENGDVVGVLGIIPSAGAEPLEIPFKTRNAEGDYQSHEQFMEQVSKLKTEIRPGATIYLNFKNFPGVKNGSFNAGVILKIVEDDSPLLGVSPSDKTLFSFRWGNFFRGFDLFGRSFKNSTGETVWADISTHFEHYETSASELAQMLELAPQLWRVQEMVGTPMFKAKFQNLEAEFVPGKGFPKEFVEAVRKNLVAGGEPLKISGIRTNAWDISPLTINFYPQADAAKPTFSPGKTGQSKPGERGLVMLPISPNPVSGGEALAVFEMPEAADVRLLVYREDMKLVNVFSKTCHSGRNEMAISAVNLTESGVYICVLETPFGSVREKLVVP